MNHRRAWYNPDQVNLFDGELEEFLVQNGMVDDLFYLRDINSRRLYLDGIIDQDTVSQLTRHILAYNRSDQANAVLGFGNQHILLYINSLGGDVDAGLSLVDTIATSATPVYTVNLGYAYSMAALVALAGHQRFAMPNAKYLLHDGTGVVCNSGMKMQDQVQFQSRIDGRIRDFVLARSNLSESAYQEKLRTEWYFFADEAKEMGFVDQLIGTDCTIQEVS